MKKRATKKQITSPLKRLFEVVHAIGETLQGAVHIIDMTGKEDLPTDGDIEYRVYHVDGYCWDISRTACDDDESLDNDGFKYVFFDEWEGFQKISDVQVAISKIEIAFIDPFNYFPLK